MFFWTGCGDGFRRAPKLGVFVFNDFLSFVGLIKAWKRIGGGGVTDRTSREKADSIARLSGINVLVGEFVAWTRSYGS
jgi:hypothetical protein